MFCKRSGIYVIFSFLFFLEPACAGNATSDIFHFTCDDGKLITATHPDVGTAELLIDGRPFFLHQVPENDGIRYTTEKGLTSQSGLVFWSRGDKAKLYKTSNTENFGTETSNLIAKCVMDSADKQRMETQGVTITKINRVRGANGIIEQQDNSKNTKINE